MDAWTEDEQRSVEEGPGEMGVKIGGLWTVEPQNLDEFSICLDMFSLNHLIVGVPNFDPYPNRGNSNQPKQKNKN